MIFARCMAMVLKTAMVPSIAVLNVFSSAQLHAQSATRYTHDTYSQASAYSHADTYAGGTAQAEAKTYTQTNAYPHTYSESSAYAETNTYSRAGVYTEDHAQQEDYYYYSPDIDISGEKSSIAGTKYVPLKKTRNYTLYDKQDPARERRELWLKEEDGSIAVFEDDTGDEDGSIVSYPHYQTVDGY